MSKVQEVHSQKEPNKHGYHYDAKKFWNYFQKLLQIQKKTYCYSSREWIYNKRLWSFDQTNLFAKYPSLQSANYQKLISAYLVDDSAELMTTLKKVD